MLLNFMQFFQRIIFTLILITPSEKLFAAEYALACRDQFGVLSVKYDSTANNLTYRYGVLVLNHSINFVDYDEFYPIINYQHFVTQQNLTVNFREKKISIVKGNSKQVVLLCQ